jgi:hypothetical protein
MLAVSLHAVTKEVRDEIVPINKKYHRGTAAGLPPIIPAPTMPGASPSNM